ncbi:MmcQ/YjbR family DNA-binding protein [Rhodanobacter sp. L36]|uniref:MmcQ/YjbR family DNA-binding protein n=1 Tax=Rhodanobacter sp. L36 TaxID=1747221 RepID=UPI00131DFEF8|nr:MmcQ/YjbR family DNA-binding protein [Rhodanobacter sp. L36]
MTHKRKSNVTYELLKQQALELPEVETSTSYGTPALKVRGKLMVRLKEDGETVVLRTTWEERERLMVVHPEMFFITEHYRNHPWVLLRLAVATHEVVEHALANAWSLVAPRSLLKKHEQG